jgi:sulfur carrier protein
MGEPLNITVIVNGESRAVPTGSTAGDLVESLGFAGRPLAVEVNEEVVPRARLSDCRLEPGDRLELVTLVGGG